MGEHVISPPEVQAGDVSPWMQQAPVGFGSAVFVQILLKFSPAHALQGFWGAGLAITGAGPSFLLSITSSLLAAFPPFEVAVKYTVAVYSVFKLI